MSSLTSFPNFSDLPFKLRDLIWLFSLDELALIWKPRELGSLFYPLQQQNWQPRDATGQMSSPEEDREEAKERQLPLYQYRQRIPHFGVNGEARAAASSWASKQEAGWLAAHQGCVDPRRCATWFDGDRKALAQPRPFSREENLLVEGIPVDGFYLSQAEYERCCDVLGRSGEGQHRPGVNWKLGQLWLQPPICKYQKEGFVFPPLALPLAVLRQDPDALRNNQAVGWR